jgi:hypothetical protein
LVPRNFCQINEFRRHNGTDVAFSYQRSADRAASVVQTIKKGWRGLAIQADSAELDAIRRTVGQRATQLEGLIFWSVA